MSKVFWDHLIVIEEFDVHIKTVTKESKTRSRLRKKVDELINTRILRAIFDRLPFEYHSHFLEKFHESPYDEELLRFLDEKTDDDIEEVIKNEIEEIKKELADITSNY